MAFVNVKAAAFLVGKEGFNAISAPVIATGLVLVFQIAEQVNGVLIAAAPPCDQVHLHRGGLCEPNLAILPDALFLKGDVGNGMLSEWAVHVDLRRSA